MHEPTLASLKQPKPAQGAMSAAGKAKKQKGKQKRLRTDGMGAFASADDYVQDIEQDLAALPANVELSEQGADEQSQKTRRKPPCRASRSATEVCDNVIGFSLLLFACWSPGKVNTIVSLRVMFVPCRGRF